MSFKSASLALLSGIVIFLIVGVAVTEFAQRWTEFSLLLGIPAGLATGAFTAAAVYLGLATDAPARRRRVASSIGAFGVGFTVLLVGLAWMTDVGVTTALVISVVVALAGAGVVYSRGPKLTASTIGDESDTRGGVN